MIFFKTTPESDPFYDLWNSPEWLFPFENKKKLVFPKILTIEPTNACQNECVYCLMRLMDRPTGRMSLDSMKKIAEEASKFNASIRFGGFGEPLIHKKIIELVEICKHYGVRTSIFTNGKLLTENMLAKFCEFGLDEIRFSGAGLTPQRHEEIRVNSDYDKDFRKPIMLASAVRNKMQVKKPFYCIYTNVFSYDEAEFIDWKDEYVDDYLQYVDKVDIDLTNFSRVKDLEATKPYYKKQTIHQVYKPCVTLYHKNIIHWNGDVFACDIPYDFMDEYHLGNINDEGTTIHDLYHSNKMRDLRVRTDNLEHANMPLCKDCYSNTTKYDGLKLKMKAG